MLIRPDQLLKLIEGMEAHASKGFRVSPQTAPTIVEALRLYARMHAIEPANFKVEKWDWRNQHVEEIVATTSLLLVARAAFDVAREQYTCAKLTSGVLLDSSGDRRGGAALCSYARCPASQIQPRNGTGAISRQGDRCATSLLLVTVRHLKRPQSVSGCAAPVAPAHSRDCKT